MWKIFIPDLNITLDEEFDTPKEAHAFAASMASISKYPELQKGQTYTLVEE